ncbi:hypothetical protein BDY24DRAFT_399683 [Mrakia frigida]|uniref:Mex67p n=1 Tax=Mrakia frigida TaxID=29902 RepID=UPI003FCBEFC1
MSIAEASMDTRPSGGPLRRGGGGRGGNRGGGRMHMPGSSRPQPDGLSPANSTGSSSRGGRGAHTLNGGPRGSRNPAGSPSGRGGAGGSGGKSARADPMAGTKARTGTIEHLRAWLLTRWSPESRMLNLSAMSHDPWLLEREVFPPGHKNSRSAMAKVLWKLVAELKPPVITISYENNKLTNTDSLEALTQFVPTVRNFSIANNPLTDLTSIKAMISLKTGLMNLHELITVGCPFRDKEIAERGEEGYRTLMTTFHPFLRLLDSKPIFSITYDVKAEQIPDVVTVPALTTTATNSEAPNPRPIPRFPLPMIQNFISGDADFVRGFLAKFFPLFDTSRSSLAPIYLPESTFSLAMNTTIAPRARAAGLQTILPNQKSLTWKPYTSISRNLLRMSKLADRVSRLHVGGEAIMKIFAGKSGGGGSGEMGVPVTKHPLERAEKWSVDSYPVEREVGGPVLLVTVHGEFEEMPVMGLRSFDRSFILSPSPPDSAARTAGWPCVILSDQLTVRNYTSSTAWEPDCLPLEPNSVIVPVVAAPQLSDQDKEILISQFSQKSGLNVAFSYQCLEGNGWDLERAWVNFLELKDQIPKDGYLS